MQAEIRLHEALQGLPAKDTTLRMQECPGFKHDLPIPLAKHFDFSNVSSLEGEWCVTFALMDEPNWEKRRLSMPILWLSGLHS